MTELTGVVPSTDAGRKPTSRLSRFAVVEWLAILVLAIACVVTAVTPLLPLIPPNDVDLVNTLTPPSAAHWLGTDDLGRDLLSRLLWGTRTSMLSAVVAIATAVVFGLPLGIFAGYVRGWIDQGLGRLADVVLTVPALILLLAAKAALDADIYVLMFCLGIILAPRLFRVIRGETHRVAGQPFVMAGRMSGCSHARILGWYIIPAIRAQIAVQVSYLFGISLLVEGGISFLGVGVQPPNASLGSLLSNASSLLVTQPVVVIIPAVVLSALILSLNIIGDTFSRRRST